MLSCHSLFSLSLSLSLTTTISSPTHSITNLVPFLLVALTLNNAQLLHRSITLALFQTLVTLSTVNHTSYKTMDLARSPSQPQSGTALEISRDATPLPSEKNNLQQDSSPRLLLTSESNSKKILATTTEYDNNSSNNKQAHSDDDKTLSTVISVTSNSLLSSVHASCDNIVPTTIPDDSQNVSHTNMTNVMPIEVSLFTMQRHVCF